MTATRKFISLTISDSPADPFTLPEIGIMALVDADLRVGTWSVSTVPQAEGAPTWQASGESLHEALIRILAARIGVHLPEGCDGSCACGGARG